MRLVILLMSLVLPAQVVALSCTPWNVESAYNLAAKSQRPYIVVLGTITFDETDLPVVDFSKQHEVPPHTTIAARLVGKSMTLSGFNRNFDHPVTLAVNCVGPWCATATSDTDTLAFVERIEDDLVVRASPCAPMVFQNPSDNLVRRVLSCFSGGTCKPATR